MDIGYSPVRIANGRTGYLGDVNNDYYYKNISKKLIGTNTSGYDDNNNFQRFLDEYDFLESDGGFDQTGAWQKNIKNGLYLLPHEKLVIKNIIPGQATYYTVLAPYNKALQKAVFSYKLSAYNTAWLGTKAGNNNQHHSSMYGFVVNAFDDYGITYSENPSFGITAPVFNIDATKIKLEGNQIKKKY